MLRNLLLVTLALATIIGVAACGGGTSGGDTPSPAATPPASSPTQSAGDPAAQFAELCAGCHKADGSGGFGPDLRDEDNVGGIAAQIRDGGDRMPAFAGDLTDQQIKDLAAYVAAEL
jgi:mono/diheme cytochrome c family protein